MEVTGSLVTTFTALTTVESEIIPHQGSQPWVEHEEYDKIEESLATISNGLQKIKQYLV